MILTDALNFRVSVLVKGTQYQTPSNKQIIVPLSKAGRCIHILQVCKKYGYSLDLLHGLIIPFPTYGISVWGTASYNEYFFLIDKFQKKAVCFGFLKKAMPVLSLLQASDNKLWRASQILPRSLWQISSHPVKQDC